MCIDVKVPHADHSSISTGDYSGAHVSDSNLVT